MSSILVLLEKLVQKDKRFTTANKSWGRIIDLHSQDGNHEDFLFFPYTENLVDDKYQLIGKVMLFLKEQRAIIDDQIRTYDSMK